MSCIVCGSKQFRARFSGSDRLYHTTSKSFTVVECDPCGLLRLEPRPSPSELPGYYPDNYWFAPDQSTAGRLEETWRRLVLRDHVRFVSQALRRVAAGGPLVDIGCGGGLFLGMMRERGFRGFGLDFSREAAAVAWREQGVAVICGSLEQNPLAPGSCAAVTMFHVLEHLPDPAAYLAAAHSILRPDGCLVVQVPNAACWQFRLLGERWNGIDIPRHLIDFRDRDLEKLLDRCGFRVVRRKYFSLRDNPAGLASSLAPALDPMARRIRRLPEGGAAKLAKDLLYLTLLLSSLPFALLEAAAGAGSSVMFEARKKS